MSAAPHTRHIVVHGLLSEGFQDSTSIHDRNPWLQAVVQFEHAPMHDELRIALAKATKHHVSTVRITGWTEVSAEAAAHYLDPVEQQEEIAMEPRRYKASDECVIL